MNAATKTMIALAAAAVLATPILAQQGRGGERAGGECRAEIVKLCGSDRSQMRTCLREKYTELSEGCQATLRERMQARGGMRGERGAAMVQAPAPQTLAYGSDALQGLDLWVPEGATPAPLVLFVHGGGWKRGSKSNAVGRALPGHMLAQGYAFASIDYRLVPAATVEQQAHSLPRLQLKALVQLQANTAIGIIHQGAGVGMTAGQHQPRANQVRRRVTAGDARKRQ